MYLMRPGRGPTTPPPSAGSVRETTSPLRVSCSVIIIVTSYQVSTQYSVLLTSLNKSLNFSSKCGPSWPPDFGLTRTRKVTADSAI